MRLGDSSASVMLNLSIPPRSYNYGPCIGTTRIQRWQRAKALGLNPPIEVGYLWSGVFVQATEGDLPGVRDPFYQGRARGPRIRTECALRRALTESPIPQCSLLSMCKFLLVPIAGCCNVVKLPSILSYCLHQSCPPLRLRELS